MQHCKSIDTPIAKGEGPSWRMCPKTPQEEEYMKKVPYISVVVSLMYVMICTRPNICFAIGIVSWYQSNPGLAVRKAIKWILRYLKETVDYSLL